MAVYHYGRVPREYFVHSQRLDSFQSSSEPSKYLVQGGFVAESIDLQTSCHIYGNCDTAFWRHGRKNGDIPGRYENAGNGNGQPWCGEVHRLDVGFRHAQHYGYIQR